VGYNSVADTRFHLHSYPLLPPKSAKFRENSNFNRMCR